VIFVCDSHEEDDLEFEMFPVHCVKGTREAEIIPELKQYYGHILSKKRYSAFYDTDLEDILENLSPEKISICGVCTDICVLHTAADARNRDYKVEIHAEAVASFDEGAHINALAHMENILGVSVIR
jgi:nicotinamidase/pyrazinamidase